MEKAFACEFKQMHNKASNMDKTLLLNISWFDFFKFQVIVYYDLYMDINVL